MATLKRAISAGPPARPDDERRDAGDDARPPAGASGGTTAPRRRPRPSDEVDDAHRLAVVVPRCAARTSALSAGGERVQREVDDPVARRAPAVARRRAARPGAACAASAAARVLVAGGRHGRTAYAARRGRPPTKVDASIDPGRGGGGSATPILPAMIDSEGLTKRYDGRSVIEDVSFRCEPGTVTGFLGPNGAGKTTTMRVLCGLSEPDAGRATVLGGPYRDLPNPGRRVGRPARRLRAAPGRRGREALAVSAQTIGVPERRVDDLLALVGLDRSAARKRVRQYSLGMRQRLGLAHALLGDPEVLILDEPANGLDPEGMRWMRGLLRDFADRGGTVLLSSHLLGEVQAVADRIVIIGAGRIVAQGSRDELLADAGTLVRAARRGGAGRRAARRRPRRPRDATTAPSSSTPSPKPSAAPRSRAASRSPTSARRRAPGSSSCSST